MKDIFRKLRKHPQVNRVVRNGIKSLYSFNTRRIQWLMDYWHVSGQFSVTILNYEIRLFSQANDSLSSKLYYGKNWEETEIRLFDALCKGAKTIFDVGGNIGLYSLIGAKSNPQSTIYCFEPNPVNIERIKNNITLNSAGDKIKVIEEAVGEYKDKLVFYLPEEDYTSDVSSFYKGHTASFSDHKLKEIKVPVVAIDDFTRTMEVSPDLIKIDVELYEFEVLKGMKNYIKKKDPLILIEIFNDVVKRKLNPHIDGEIKRGLTLEIEKFLLENNYMFYLISDVGIIKVRDLRSNPQSSMYLLTKKALVRDFYPLNEFRLVKEELLG